jgi:hypothetical protein
MLMSSVIVQNTSQYVLKVYVFFPFVCRNIKTRRRKVQLLLPFFGECLFERQLGQAVEPFVQTGFLPLWKRMQTYSSNEPL